MHGLRVMLRSVKRCVLCGSPEISSHPQADDVTIVESYTSEDTLSGEESAKYAEITDGLMAESVTGDEAHALITRAAASLG